MMRSLGRSLASFAAVSRENGLPVAEECCQIERLSHRRGCSHTHGAPALDSHTILNKCFCIITGHRTGRRSHAVRRLLRIPL